jgi:hypothetical protein
MAEANKIVSEVELFSKISNMPVELKSQVNNFVDFLIYKENKKRMEAAKENFKENK